MATSCFRGRPPATKPGHGRARLETHCCQDVRRGVALRRCRPVRTMALPAAFVAPPKAPPLNRRPAVANAGPPARGKALPPAPTNLPNFDQPRSKALSQTRPDGKLNRPPKKPCRRAGRLRQCQALPPGRPTTTTSCHGPDRPWQDLDAVAVPPARLCRPLAVRSTVRIPLCEALPHGRSSAAMDCHGDTCPWARPALGKHCRRHCRPRPGLASSTHIIVSCRARHAPCRGWATTLLHGPCRPQKKPATRTTGTHCGVQICVPSPAALCKNATPRWPGNPTKSALRAEPSKIKF